jgi:NAD(P)-dependent dehydrogenase (short-subunit alcohol dehydrogenase family)
MTGGIPARQRRGRSRWEHDDIPDLTGRTAAITGSNSGIGLETARILAARGARVLLACRSEVRARAAVRDIRTRSPQAQVDYVHVDTSDVVSVRVAAAEIAERTDRLDLLINNAGVAWPPYEVSPQGVELQFATNFLGHFALTGLLLDRLLAAPAARVVSLTSLAHYAGKLRLDDLADNAGYRPFAAYARSKLAVLLFTAELQRRFEGAGVAALAVAAHPGGARTELIRHEIGPGRALLSPNLVRRLFQFQSAAMGALPILRAALDPAAHGGECFAPGGMFELKGHPDVGRTSRKARAADDAISLWHTAERITGVHYRFEAPHV